MARRIQKRARAGAAWGRRFIEGRDGTPMLRNTVRGILGLVLAAGATWLANFIVEKVFGPEEAESGQA
jgi:hypothetical protein